jgi:hypothetical protein
MDAARAQFHATRSLKLLIDFFIDGNALHWGGRGAVESITSRKYGVDIIKRLLHFQPVSNISFFKDGEWYVPKTVRTAVSLIRLPATFSDTQV